MTMDQMFAKWGGGEVLRRAVRGMLPKNRLQDSRLARLKSKCCTLFASRSCGIDGCIVQFLRGTLHDYFILTIHLSRS
jgi:hypothetical protein